MTQVAFATYQSSPDVSDDDRLVADILKTKGITVVPAVWDDPAVEWAQFAGVVIRSTWDYHRKAVRYDEWLRRRAADGTNLWNPPAAVLANLNKRYLSDLADRGISVVPTAYLPAGGGRRLHQVLESHGWQEAVIKPAVSASAQGTWRTSLATGEADQARFEDQCRAGDVLIQPYLREVVSHGEWSLVFFAGRFSHAALKRPTRGDFRVQGEFGGSAVPASPRPDWIAQARAALSAAGAPLLYARVDAVERDGRFLLMELEINEPSLFLSLSGAAPARFAETIEAVLVRGRNRRTFSAFPIGPPIL